MRKQRVTGDLPNETRELEIKLELVKEARALFGEASAKFTWQIMGLPVCEAPVRQYASFRSPSIDAFLASRTVPNAQGEVRAGVLYKEYVGWSKASRVPLLSLVAFGKAIAAAGISKRKSRVHFYVGIVLNPDPL